MVNTTVPVTIGGNRIRIFFNRKTYKNGYDTSDNLSSQNGTHIILAGNRLHTGYVSKADTHDHGKLCPKLKILSSDYRKKLQQSTDSRDKQGCLDQDHPVRSIQICYACHNNGRGYTADDHSYYMLQSQRKGLAEFRHAIHFKDRSFGF